MQLKVSREKCRATVQLVVSEGLTVSSVANTILNVMHSLLRMPHACTMLLICESVRCEHAANDSRTSTWHIPGSNRCTFSRYLNVA